jgi:D-serine deaminase-like pyridoxal phosphate-dependent protein
MPKGKSGAQIGAENVAKLRQYLETVNSLPARNGKPHVTAIAIAAGLDRQVAYKNAECRRLIQEAAQTKGLRGIEATPVQVSDVGQARLERRVSELERANAVLLTEVGELRARLRRYAHIEAHLVETGRLPR